MSAHLPENRQGLSGMAIAAREAPAAVLPPRPAPDIWRHQHVLDLDDFTVEEIELVMETAGAMKEVLARPVPRVPTLRGTTVITLFYEASTRTRSSFELAGKILGADVINIAASSSSVSKGESLVDTVLTLQAVGADILVMRHSRSGAPYLAARHTRASVINAGDGWHAHPSQALLDLFTIRSYLGDARGRKVLIVGDITHSRVARSNLWGLTRMGAHVTVCGPPTLLPVGLEGPQGAEAANELDRLPPVEIETDLDRAIKDADVVMTLRLQFERMQSGLIPSIREYCNLYQVTAKRLAKARPHALVLHPGPVNEGVEISLDVAHGTQSVIEEQVANGVAIRMALLYLLSRAKA
ncbi:MAG: aspartate carbamoyltransferase catalytic subunit [Dehalococcoidia bacterium]|nr:aspartate carbamoyltransferase catalytic subunit [Dehalococcoidia bacterium]